MVKIIDCTIQNFMRSIKYKRIIAFGVGRQFERFVIFYKLEKQIICAVDNDPSKQNKKVCINNEVINVFSPLYLQNANIRDTVILITSFFEFANIIQQLDSISNIENIECYVCSFMQENCEKQNISFAWGKQLIPKIIHYCWFGGNELPDRLKYYMESWNKLCPDYEIKRWDETNYDISKNQYMSEAYEHKKWGFVPDYARLDIIYQYGGIYLDTDVEIIRNFDDLLSASSFMGFFDINSVNLGIGFGAQKGNELIMKMRNYYNNKTFVKLDGSLDMRVCNEYQDPVLKEYGFKMDNSMQSINNNILYPVEVFNPEGKTGYHKNYSNNTHSIHRSQMSYIDKKIKKNYFEGVQKIRDRMEKYSAGNMF